MRFATPRASRRRALGTAGSLALIALSVLTATAADAQVPIIDLHHNDSLGRPVSPYAFGTPVTVSGILTVGIGTFTPTFTDVFVQDATGGIQVYNAGVPYGMVIGDSVTISGTIGHYLGSTQVEMTGATIHSSGHPEPTPLVVDCDDIEHAFLPDYSEPNEGRLVRINNVMWTGAWPSFSGGVTLHDASGTCTLFIDGTTGVQEITPPSGSFDVIGVVKQYDDYTSPWTTNYELLPRSPEDIVLLGGPQILVGPYETDLQPTQVTIHLETGTETTVDVEYGETDAYELGTATDGLSAFTHDVVLAALDPATIHHFRVTVYDLEGQSTTPDRLFSTASAPGGAGTIHAIFNKSVDTSYATYEQATGGQVMEGWLIDRINATQSTIDVALYSFDLPAVGDALIAAKDRGVTIRFVYDNRTTYQQEVTRLMNNGIWVIDDAYGTMNDGSGIMHHKLWIFDAASADPADPWVYTGSWNLSTQGTYTDAQNMVMIQDQALAQVCTYEFNEMWGSEIWLPNPDLARFGDNKLDNTPKRFLIGGHEVEFYFAPSDPWLQAMIDEVAAADHSIFFCAMSYTRYDLCNEMEERWMNVPGMEVRGVFDSGESGNTYSQYHPMHGDGEYPWAPPADVWLDGETGILHHKYMILDVDRPASDPVLITGSANWSTSANDENDENVVIIHDPALANVYLQEFAERYHAAGGSGLQPSSAVEPVADLPAALRVGPNPVLHDVWAAFQLAAPGRVTCDLYAVDGRRIQRLSDGTYSAGPHTLRWDASPEGTPLPAGIYFLRVTTPIESTTRRLTVVR